MHLSKGLIHHCLILLVAAATLSGCTPKRAEPNTTGVGSIFISDCGGRVETLPVDKKINPNWLVPQTLNLAFTACLRDKSTKQEMAGHKFEARDIETGRGVQTSTANDSGCVSWTEQLPYNHFANQTGSIELKRELHEQSLGARTDAFSFYVRPWAGDVNDRRDPGKSVLCSAKGEAAPPDLVKGKAAQANLLSNGSGLS
jgi:hypothetical protein